MKPHNANSGLVLTVLIVIASTLGAQDVSRTIGKFSGTWKQNEAKSKFGSNLNLRFRLNAKGEMEELRGPESRPIVEPVIFDGKTYPIDGANMIEWKQIDAHKVERKIFDARTSPGKQGKLITTRKLQISPDGKTVREETERMLADGKASLTTITYTRTSGDSQGLVGIWKLSTLHSNRPPVLKLEPAGNNALKISVTITEDLTYTLTFDGKDAQVVGPDVVSKFTASGKLVDNHTIEVTQSREGVISNKSSWELSPDGKTMTVTTTWMGPNVSPEPSIEVYEKQ
jgi:hypothetical protein